MSKLGATTLSMLNSGNLLGIAFISLVTRIGEIGLLFEDLAVFSVLAKRWGADNAVQITTR